MRKKLPIEKKLLSSLLKKGKDLAKHHEILDSRTMLRMLRTGLGMNQRQLAKRARISRSTIARIENGEFLPNEETLGKLFAALGCDLAIIPIPRFEDVDSYLKAQARRIAMKRMQKLEGTMALEGQRPQKKWREWLLENEIETILKQPGQLWDES